jgi:hypothetical protein
MSDPSRSSERPLLNKDEIAGIRRLYNIVFAPFGVLATLHLAAAISVLPNVWVSDPAANCGARLVLSHAVDGFFFLFLCFLGGSFLFVLIIVLQGLIPELRHLTFFSHERVNPFVFVRGAHAFCIFGHARFRRKRA